MPDLVTISISPARVEAVVVASMLEGYGIPVHIGSDRQCATEYWSLAFGGYRLWVSEDDYEVASEIIRQSGVLEMDQPRTGPSKPLIRFLKGYFGAHVFGIGFAGLMVPLWSIPLYFWAMIGLNSIIIPVSPQVRADYFLAEAV